MRNGLATRDTIKDFTSGESIDIADVLSDFGYDSGTDVLADLVSITRDVYHSYLSVDRDGTGGSYGMTQVTYTEKYNTLATGDLITA